MTPYNIVALKAAKPGRGGLKIALGVPNVLDTATPMVVVMTKVATQYQASATNLWGVVLLE